MTEVVTGSRLHFGLFTLAPPERWPDLSGAPAHPARRFGGVGLMVDAPGVRLAVEPAAAWSATGPLAERALAFARRFAESLPPGTVPPHVIRVEQAAPEHAGLGTGTQLGLATARALAVSSGLPEMAAEELARRVGRGARSALGVHGFAHGGFLVEVGQSAAGGLSPLLARVAFPEAWRIVLVLPAGEPGLHGGAEVRAFRELAGRPDPPATTDALCRLVLLGMLPALAERDLATFGEALYDFNARIGELFAAVQGGRYAGPAVAAAVHALRQLGARGTGQSSWGPAVFAVVEDQEQAAHLANRAAAQLGLGPGRLWLTGPRNQGAVRGDEASPIRGTT